MKIFSIAFLITILVEFGLATALTRTGPPTDPRQPRAAAPRAIGGIKRNIPYRDANPILEALRDDLLPAELRDKTAAQRERLWPTWVSQRDAEIRARLERGDEDSIVNFLLFGVTFTKRPRIKLAEILGNVPAGLELLQGRIDDLARAAASPGSNERLQFVGRVLRRKGHDPATAAGKERTRGYLRELT